MKKYNIILCDPPWDYNKRNNKTTKFGGGAMGHYNTMSLQQIKDLSIQNIAADNCVLFMWVTFPKLQEGLDVIKSWSFQYKTLGFSWHKLNKDGSLFFGTGSYTKSNSEVCLLATKGRVGIMKKDEDGEWVITPPEEKVCTVSNYVSSAINAPRERHSKKPDNVRERIVQLFGDLPRVELFAREKVEGWDNIGFDIDGVTIEEKLRRWS